MQPSPATVSDALTSVASVLDAAGNLTESRACVRCGYSLCGLPFDGACPECGCPVKRSFMGDLLEYSDPGYVAGLHRGCVAVMWGIGLSIAAWVVVLGWTVLSPSARGGAGMSFQGMVIVVAMIALLGAAIAAWGYWQFARADPSQLTVNKGEWVRHLLRACVIADLAAQGALTVMVGAPFSTFGLTGLFVPVLIIKAVAIVTLFYAATGYARWLAARIPDAKARDSARQLQWSGPILVALVACFFVFGLIITLVMYFMFFNRLRRGFARVRDGRRAVGAVVAESGDIAL